MFFDFLYVEVHVHERVSVHVWVCTWLVMVLLVASLIPSNPSKYGVVENVHFVLLPLSKTSCALMCPPTFTWQSTTSEWLNSAVTMHYHFLFPVAFTVNHNTLPTKLLHNPINKLVNVIIIKCTGDLWLAERQCIAGKGLSVVGNVPNHYWEKPQHVSDYWFHMTDWRTRHLTLASTVHVTGD